MKTTQDTLNSLTDWIYSLQTPTKKKPNITEKLLFSSAEPLYEKLSGFLLKTLIKDHKTRVNPNDREDLVGEFLIFLVEKDKLKEFEGKKINFNAVYWHFTQFIARDKYSNAQDVQRRTIDGVRTQAEQSRFKQGVEIKSFISTDTHKALARKNEDGEIERDYVSNDMSPEDNAIRNFSASHLNNKILKLFKSEYGEQWKFMFNIYNNKLNDTYDTLNEWSQAEGISLPTLKNKWSHIQDLMKKKGLEYFQTEPTKIDNIKMINKWISKGCPNLV